MSLIVLIC